MIEGLLEKSNVVDLDRCDPMDLLNGSQWHEHAGIQVFARLRGVGEDEGFIVRWSGFKAGTYC